MTRMDSDGSEKRPEMRSKPIVSAKCVNDFSEWGEPG